MTTDTPNSPPGSLRAISDPAPAPVDTGSAVLSSSSPGPGFWKIDASVVVTVIVLGGFCLISYLAMKPDLAGVKESVVLYLLGAWQSMAAAAVAYWIGSSASSKAKDQTIADSRKA